MENPSQEQIIEEINIRKGRFKPLRLAYWLLGLIFLFIFADMFFLKILNLQDYGDFRTPVNVMLFFTYSQGNVYFIHDFLTDKLGDISNLAFMPKIGILCWNIVCLGHLFGLNRFDK